jgi:PRTRC genetic system protein E
MFTAFAGFLGPDEKIVVEISGVASDGRMKVLVMPKAGKGANAALAIPLALVATPQELDAEFIGTVMEYGEQRKSLKEQAAVTATILAAAQQAEVGKATKGLQGKTTKPAAASSSASSTVGDEGGDDDNGDDVLDGDTGNAAPAQASATYKAASQGSAAPAGGNDDLLSLLGN